MVGKSMKVCVVAIAGMFLFSVFPAFGQVTERNPFGSLTQDQDVQNNPFFNDGEGEAPADSVKKKERRPRQPLESYHFPDSVRGRQNIKWTIDPFVNSIEIGSIDTLQNGFQIQYPFHQKGVGSAYLGNLGAPSVYLSYFDREQSRDHSFSNPWGVYLRTVATTPFYNVKSPFTQLSYAWAGQKSQQEEDFAVIHAQNYSPQTGFNVNYRSLGTKGVYSWQATNNKTLSLALSHTGKRYTVHAGYIYNSVYNRENGGVVDDDAIRIFWRNYEMSSRVPMRLSDPRNWIKNNTYFLMQSYGVPLRRVTQEDFTIADRPAVFIGHIIEYNRWVRRYEDTFKGTQYNDLEGNVNYYYDDWFVHPERSADSLFEGKLSNRVFVQIQPWNRGGVIGVIDGGVGVDMFRYHRFDMSEYLNPRDADRYTSYYAYGGIDGRVRKYFDWKADFRIHPFGYRAGDLEVGGEAAARIYIKGHPLSLSGKFRFSSLEPSYWDQNFFFNHFVWSNSFQKENETRLDVTLAAPRWGFEASGFQSVIDNKVYYGADYRPAQAGGVVSVSGVYLREDLRLGGVNLNHRVMLQWSTDQMVVPVPLFSAYLSYFYEFNVVKNVLRLQIGVDGRFNTRYYAPGYNPGTGQFYNQRVRQLGEYAWLDVFVNAKWKRMRILLKLQHLNEGLFGVRDYFSVLHYPMNPRIFKIGISWNFYD